MFKRKRKKVLLVGGEGFIGSHLSTTLEVLGFDVYICDLKSGHDAREGIDGKWDTIVFLAVDMTQTLDAYRYNQQLYEALDTYMSWHPNTQVIYSSSAAVYGSGRTPHIELQIPAPSNIYGQSKLLGEVYVQQYRNHVILRFANVYGFGEGHGVVDRFRRGERTIYGSGNDIRDYVSVMTVAEAIIEAIKKPDGWYGITNISSGTGITVNGLWKKLGKGEPVYDRKRKGDVHYSVLDNTRMRTLMYYENHDEN